MQSLQQRMDDWKQRVRILMNQILTVDQYYVANDEYRFTGQASYADIAAGRTSPSSRGCSPYRNQRDEPPPSCSLPIQKKSIEVENVDDDNNDNDNIQSKHVQQQIQMQNDEKINKDNDQMIIRSIQHKEQTPMMMKEETIVTDNTMNNLPVINVVESVPRRGRSPVRKSIRSNLHTNVKKYDNTRSPVSSSTGTDNKQVLISEKNSLIPSDDKRGRSTSPIWVPGSTSYADILRGGTHATSKSSDSTDNDTNQSIKETHSTHSNVIDDNHSINPTISETHTEDIHTIESESVKTIESSISIGGKSSYEQTPHEQQTIIEKDKNGQQHFTQETDNTWSNESLEHSNVIEDKHYDNINQSSTTEPYKYIHPQTMAELVGFIGSQLGAYPVGSYVYAPVEIHQQMQLDAIAQQHYGGQMTGYTTNHYVNQNNYLPTTTTTTTGICHESHLQQQQQQQQHECSISESDNTKEDKMTGSQSSSVIEASNVELPSYHSVSNITEQSDSNNEINVSLNPMNMDDNINPNNIEKKNTNSVSNNTENKNQVFSYAQILSQGLNSRSESTNTDKSMSEQIRGRSGSPKIVSTLQHDLPIIQSTITNPQEDENIEKIQSKQSKGNDWDTMKKKDTKKKHQSRPMEKSKYNQDKRSSISMEKTKDHFEKEVTPSKESVVVVNKSQNVLSSTVVSGQKTNPPKKDDKLEMKQQKKKSDNARQKQEQTKEKLNQQQQMGKNDQQKEKLDQLKDKQQDLQKDKQKQSKEQLQQTPDPVGTQIEKKRKQKKKKLDKTIDDEIDKALKEIEDMDKQRAKIQKEKYKEHTAKNKKDIQSNSKKVELPSTSNETDNLYNLKTSDVKQIDTKSEQLSSQLRNIDISKDKDSKNISKVVEDAWKINESISNTIEAYTEKLKAIKKNQKINIKSIDDVWDNAMFKKKLTSSDVIESKEQPIEKPTTRSVISSSEIIGATSSSFSSYFDINEEPEMNTKKSSINTQQDKKVKSTKKLSKVSSKVKETIPSKKQVIEDFFSSSSSFYDKFKETEDKILSEIEDSNIEEQDDKFYMEPLCKDDTGPNELSIEEIQISKMIEDNIHSFLIKSNVEFPEVKETIVEEFVDEKGDLKKEEVERIINPDHDLESSNVNNDNNIFKTIGTKTSDVISLRPETVEASLTTTYARVSGSSLINVPENNFLSCEVSHDICDQSSSPIVPIISEIIQSDDPPLFGSIKDRKKYRNEISPMSSDLTKNKTLDENQLASFGDDSSISMQTVINVDLKKDNSSYESLNDNNIIDEVRNTIDEFDEKNISDEDMKIDKNKNEFVNLKLHEEEQNIIGECQSVIKEDAKEKVIKEKDDDNKPKQVFDTGFNLDQRRTNEHLLELIKPYWLNYHSYVKAENELCSNYKIMRVLDKPCITDVNIPVNSQENIVKIVQESVMKKTPVENIRDNEKTSDRESKIIALLADVPKYPIISLSEFESQWIQSQQATMNKSISSTSTIDSVDTILPVSVTTSEIEIIEKDEVDETSSKLNETIDIQKSSIETNNQDIDTNVNKIDQSKSQIQTIHLKADDSWMSILDEPIMISDDDDDGWEENTNELKQTTSTMIKSELDLTTTDVISLKHEENISIGKSITNDDEEGKITLTETQTSISNEPKEINISVKYEDKDHSDKDNINVLPQKEMQSVAEQKSVHLESSEDWLDFLDEEIPLNEDDLEDLNVESDVIVSKETIEEPVGQDKLENIEMLEDSVKIIEDKVLEDNLIQKDKLKKEKKIEEMKSADELKKEKKIEESNGKTKEQTKSKTKNKKQNKSEIRNRKEEEDKKQIKDEVKGIVNKHEDITNKTDFTLNIDLKPEKLKSFEMLTDANKSKEIFKQYDQIQLSEKLLISLINTKDTTTKQQNEPNEQIETITSSDLISNEKSVELIPAIEKETCPEVSQKKESKQSIGKVTSKKQKKKNKDKETMSENIIEDEQPSSELSSQVLQEIINKDNNKSYASVTGSSSSSHRSSPQLLNQEQIILDKPIPIKDEIQFDKSPVNDITNINDDNNDSKIETTSSWAEEIEKEIYSPVILQSSENVESTILIPTSEDAELSKSDLLDSEIISKTETDSWAAIVARKTKETLDTSSFIEQETMKIDKVPTKEEEHLTQVQIFVEESPPIAPIEDLVHIDDQGFVEVVNRKELRSRRSRSRSRNNRSNDLETETVDTNQNETDIIQSDKIEQNKISDDSKSMTGIVQDKDTKSEIQKQKGKKGKSQLKGGDKEEIIEKQDDKFDNDKMKGTIIKDKTLEIITDGKKQEHVKDSSSKCESKKQKTKSNTKSKDHKVEIKVSGNKKLEVSSKKDIHKEINVIEDTDNIIKESMLDNKTELNDDTNKEEMTNNKSEIIPAKTIILDQESTDDEPVDNSKSKKHKTVDKRGNNSLEISVTEETSKEHDNNLEKTIISDQESKELIEKDKDPQDSKITKKEKDEQQPVIGKSKNKSKNKRTMQDKSKGNINKDKEDNKDAEKLRLENEIITDKTDINVKFIEEEKLDTRVDTNDEKMHKQNENNQDDSKSVLAEISTVKKQMDKTCEQSEIGSTIESVINEQFIAKEKPKISSNKSVEDEQPLKENDRSVKSATDSTEIKKPIVDKKIQQKSRKEDKKKKKQGVKNLLEDNLIEATLDKTEQKEISITPETVILDSSRSSNVEEINTDKLDTSSNEKISIDIISSQDNIISKSNECIIEDKTDVKENIESVDDEYQNERKEIEEKSEIKSHPDHIKIEDIEQLNDIENEESIESDDSSLLSTENRPKVRFYIADDVLILTQDKEKELKSAMIQERTLNTVRSKFLSLDGGFWPTKHPYHEAEKYLFESLAHNNEKNSIRDNKNDSDRDPPDHGYDDGNNGGGSKGGSGRCFDNSRSLLGSPRTECLVTDLPGGICSWRDYSTYLSSENEERLDNNSLQQLTHKMTENLITEPSLLHSMDTIEERLAILKNAISDLEATNLPRDSIQSMLSAIEVMIKELENYEEEAVELQRQLNEISFDTTCQIYTNTLESIQSQINTLFIQTKQSKELLEQALDIQRQRTTEINEYLMFLEETDAWLKDIVLKINDQLPMDQNLQAQLLDRSQRVSELESLPEVKDLANVLKNELMDMINRLQQKQQVSENVQNSCVMELLDEEALADDETTDRDDATIDQAPSIHSTTIESGPPSLADVSLQTGQSLLLDIIEDKPIQLTKQTSTIQIPITTSTQSLTTQTIDTITYPDQQIKETIKVVKLSEGDHDVIEIATKNARATDISQSLIRSEQSNIVPDDIIVDMKYQDGQKEDNAKSELNIHHATPQSFETVLTEPDNVTTEVVVDADGTKRIIVRKLRHTVVTNRNTEQQHASSITTALGKDASRMQAFSEATLRDQYVTVTTTKPDGTVETLTKQIHGSKVTTGIPDAEYFEEKYESTPQYTHKITQGAIRDISPLPIEEQILEHGQYQTKTSSVHAVVQQVTRRVIKKTRRIIRKVTIIDGKETTSEEIIEEPDEIEIDEQDIPHININVIKNESERTFGLEQKVTDEKKQEPSLFSGLSGNIQSSTTYEQHCPDSPMQGPFFGPFAKDMSSIRRSEVKKKPIESIIVDDTKVDTGKICDESKETDKVEIIHSTHDDNTSEQKFVTNEQPITIVQEQDILTCTVTDIPSESVIDDIHSPRDIISEVNNTGEMFPREQVTSYLEESIILQTPDEDIPAVIQSPVSSEDPAKTDNASVTTEATCKSDDAPISNISLGTLLESSTVEVAKHDDDSNILDPDNETSRTSIYMLEDQQDTRKIQEQVLPTMENKLEDNNVEQLQRQLSDIQPDVKSKETASSEEIIKITQTIDKDISKSDGISKDDIFLSEQKPVAGGKVEISLSIQKHDEKPESMVYVKTQSERSNERPYHTVLEDVKINLPADQEASEVVHNKTVQTSPLCDVQKDTVTTQTSIPSTTETSQQESVLNDQLNVQDNENNKMQEELHQLQQDAGTISPVSTTIAESIEISVPLSESPEHISEQPQPDIVEITDSLRLSSNNKNDSFGYDHGYEPDDRTTVEEQPSSVQADDINRKKKKKKRKKQKSREVIEDSSGIIKNSSDEEDDSANKLIISDKEDNINKETNKEIEDIETKSVIEEPIINIDKIPIDTQTVAIETCNVSISPEQNKELVSIGSVIDTVEQEMQTFKVEQTDSHMQTSPKSMLESGVQTVQEEKPKIKESSIQTVTPTKIPMTEDAIQTSPIEDVTSSPILLETKDSYVQTIVEMDSAEMQTSPIECIPSIDIETQTLSKVSIEAEQQTTPPATIEQTTSPDQFEIVEENVQMNEPPGPKKPEMLDFDVQTELSDKAILETTEIQTISIEPIQQEVETQETEVQTKSPEVCSLETMETQTTPEESLNKIETEEREIQVKSFQLFPLDSIETQTTPAQSPRKIEIMEKEVQAQLMDITYPETVETQTTPKDSPRKIEVLEREVQTKSSSPINNIMTQTSPVTSLKPAESYDLETQTTQKSEGMEIETQTSSPEHVETISSSMQVESKELIPHLDKTSQISAESYDKSSQVSPKLHETLDESIHGTIEDQLFKTTASVIQSSDTEMQSNLIELPIVEVTESLLQSEISDAKYTESPKPDIKVSEETMSSTPDTSFEVHIKATIELSSSETSGEAVINVESPTDTSQDVSLTTPSTNDNNETKREKRQRRKRKHKSMEIQLPIKDTTNLNTIFGQPAESQSSSLKLSYSDVAKKNASKQQLAINIDETNAPQNYGEIVDETITKSSSSSSSSSVPLNFDEEVNKNVQETNQREETIIIPLDTDTSPVSESTILTDISRPSKSNKSFESSLAREDQRFETLFVSTPSEPMDTTMSPGESPSSMNQLDKLDKPEKTQVKTYAEAISQLLKTSSVPNTVEYEKEYETTSSSSAWEDRLLLPHSTNSQKVSNSHADFSLREAMEGRIPQHQPTQKTQTTRIISDRVKSLNNAAEMDHLGNVLHVARLSEVTTDKSAEERSLDVRKELTQLRNAIEENDVVIVEETLLTVIETISTWLETIEYRIFLNRECPSGLSHNDAKTFIELKEEVDHVAENIRELDDMWKLVEVNYPIEERAVLRECFDALEQHAKAVEHVTNTSEECANNHLAKWDELLNGINNIYRLVEEQRKQLDNIIECEASTRWKLQELDKMENMNRCHMWKTGKLLATSHELLRDYPGKIIPEETYLAHEITKIIENGITIERDRLLQLLALAEEYEQTLQEFSQIIEIAENLLQSPISVMNLEHLQEEMQKHRKFFVNLNHCRVILESLEGNLDPETRAKHSDLHVELHSRASSLLDQAASRAQQMALAATRWILLEQGVKEEKGWLQVAHQRVPDLQTVNSSDYDQYISLYQSLSSDVAMHHARIIQLLDVANRLEELVTIENSEDHYNEVLDEIVKLRDNIESSLRRLLSFRENWSSQQKLINRIEGWMTTAEKELVPLSNTSSGNMRRFWELKAQYEIHNNMRNEADKCFDQALKIIPLSDEILQRQLYSELQYRWKGVTEKINDIQSEITRNISSEDVSSNERLKILERELNELRMCLDDLHGVLKTEEELDLYIERLTVLFDRVTLIQDKLSRLGLLPAAESETVGILLSSAHRIEGQIGEELDSAQLLREKLQALKRGLGRVRKSHQRHSMTLDQCEESEKQGSDVVSTAVDRCESVADELIVLWHDLMGLRQMLHKLPSGMRVSVSPVGIERDISALQDAHTELESRCTRLLSLLRNRLALWNRFEKHLEMVQQSVQEADYMMELLTVQGSVDYDRLLKATERLEGLNGDFGAREVLISELHASAEPLRESCAAEVRERVEAARFECSC
ncbi:PREDICTED: uncharacterized protein LOC106790722 [Polistes canadensis]|uniref:uncharacterized protein LOC106790722 n=1 Tax=Polistes canadensis TaxID=91411 RepID=UPI000718D507|nr:PREDICTED: uncharacterized protein LOC106790722 [Polistes canadensis]